MSNRSETINHYAQIIAIVVGAFWVLWTFVFAEVLKPQDLKSFFHVGLEMKIAGNAVLIDGTQALPIEVIVKGENLSQKRLKVASGYLEVFADKIKPSPDSDFRPENVEAILNHDKAARSRYYNSRDTERVYVATVFTDWWFEPGERQLFNRVFHIPKDKYHQLEANAYVLSGPKAETITVAHRVNTKGQVHYLVREARDASKKEYSVETEKGRELINSRTGLADSTFFLVLPSPERRTAKDIDFRPEPHKPASRSAERKSRPGR